MTVEKDGAITLITTCVCSDPGHMMMFGLQVWPNEEAELYVEVQLNTMFPWWQRLWYGLQYGFGKRSRFGHGLWDEGCISPESARQLQGLLARYLTEVDKRGNTFTAKSGN